MHFINATLINLFHVCKRELWLHANDIRMEHTSNIVSEGRLIGENTYQQRAVKYVEFQIDGIKIDFYDAKNRVVHEVKKSNKIETAHEAQVKYYLYILKKHGIDGAKGIIEYPTMRHTTHVDLNDDDLRLIPEWEAEIASIISSDVIPEVIEKPICKKCSYFEFCYSGEM